MRDHNELKSLASGKRSYLCRTKPPNAKKAHITRAFLLCSVVFVFVYFN